MIKIFKSIEVGSTNNIYLIALSIALSVPVVILGENLLFAVPVVIIVLMSFIFGERFIIGIVIISLFTLIGELSRSLRTVVHLVDFTLLGILFLKRFGLNFYSYPKVPKSVFYFLILYLFAMIISAVISKYPFAGIGLIAQQIIFVIIAYVFYSLISGVRDIKLYFTSIFIVACILVTFSLLAFSDMFGIVSTGPSSLSIDLTYDRKRLDQAINKITGSGLAPKDILEVPEGAQGPPEVRYRAHVAFSTANDIINNLAKVHNRRKAFIYVSNGYDFNPFQDTRKKQLDERLAWRGATLTTRRRPKEPATIRTTRPIRSRRRATSSTRPISCRISRGSRATRTART